MKHEDLQSLLGAYALDALDPEETTLLEAHLAECPRCRAEVAGHRETAALLGNVGGDAPLNVWERIEAELGLESSSSRSQPMPSNVVPIASRRQIPLPVLAVAACAAAVLIGLLGVSTIHLQRQVDSLSNTVSAGGLQQAAAAALLDPNHSTVQLSSAEGHLSAQVVIQDDGNAYLVDSNLPALSESHTYQLWGLNGGKIVSLGLLGSNPKVAAFRVDSSVSALMVTAEPSGGSPRPDTKVLVRGAVST